MQDYIAVKEKYARYMPHSAGRWEDFFFRDWLEDQPIPIFLTLKPVQVRSQEVPQGAVPDRGEAVQLSDDARQEQR